MAADRGGDEAGGGGEVVGRVEELLQIGADVGSHPVGVYLEVRQAVGEPGGGGSDGDEQLSERVPLGVPGAGRPLVLVA